jgi:hypothetical protein
VWSEVGGKGGREVVAVGWAIVRQESGCPLGKGNALPTSTMEW